MNQQINLYLPQFRKKKDWLDFENMAGLVVVFAVLLVVATLVEGYSSYSLQGKVDALEASLNEARERTNALIDTYGVQSEDSSLANSVKTLQENLAGKKALLNFLDGREIGNTAGFSEFLADLARYHIDGLRLTSINLRNGGESVFLGGEVSRAENVPLYLQNLRNGDSYNGKTFQTLKISNATAENQLDTVMTFDVATGISTAGAAQR